MSIEIDRNLLETFVLKSFHFSFPGIPSFVDTKQKQHKFTQQPRGKYCNY